MSKTKYNFKRGMEISKRPNLTRGQKYLYSLICVKLKDDDKLTLDEARKLYLGYRCRQMFDGVPSYYNFYWRNEKDEMVGRFEPMTEDRISMATVIWLTHNIGSLVLKGYLKVLPVLELSK